MVIFIFMYNSFYKKLEGLLQHHVSPFIPPLPLSCTITKYSVLRIRSKTECKNAYHVGTFHQSLIQIVLQILYKNEIYNQT